MKTNRTAPLVLAALLGATGQAAAQEYELHIVEALSQFGIPESYLGNVNNHGIGAGSMTYTTQDSNGNSHTTYHGYTWTPDGGPDVNQTPGSGYSDINDAGDILIGAAIRFADGHTAFMSPWANDRSVGGAEINEAGMVIGTSVFRYYDHCIYERRAVVWTEFGGTVSLESLVPNAEVGTDINNSNEVVGNTSHSGLCGDFKAFLCRVDTGEWVDLHTMLTGGGAGTTEASAINDLGQVAGEGWNGSFVSGWVWDPGAGFTYLPALKAGDRDRVRPYDLNDGGVVVGGAATDGWADQRAFIWDAAGGMRDLNDLVELPPNFILDRALEISDTGVIVGDGHWGPAWGPPVAFYLVPGGSGCAADFNADGQVNTLDVLAFLNAWSAGDASGDFNQDGDINTLDVLAFLNAWSAGC
jgi:probable HAF family extracellular repeat protein